MHNIQLVKIQPEERLAASSELNPASCLVTGCGEARGMGYWAATQVKGLSPEIFIVPEADVVVLTEGSTLIADSPIGTWQGDASPAGSETVARYQTDIMGTRETQSVLLTGVCAIKPINGKTVQTTLWESDQFIVPVKQGNACRGKGLAGARWPGRGTPSILRDGQGVSTKLWSITLRERRGCTPEEPDEGKLQVRFCEGAHSNLGAITSKKRCAMGSTRQEMSDNEADSNLIAYCGLYCGDCFAHKGKIADLARDLRKELRQSKFDKTAESLSDISFFKVFENYGQCYEVLGALVKFRCNNVCRDGGGPPFCKIRKCSQKKGIEGCWECDEFETCEKLDFLKPGHGDAHLKNLRKIKKQGVEKFIEGKRYWYNKIKGQK